VAVKPPILQRLKIPAILIWLEQADMTNGKKVIIGDPRVEEDAKSTPSRIVMVEKLPNGEETVTITIKGLHGRQP
jgi:hypothetical protein